MEEQGSSVRIVEIQDPAQLSIIEKLAWAIFPKTYTELIPPAQTPYMMRLMYDDAVLRREFADGMHFALILDGDTPVGYVSWHLTENGGERAMRLEKLYLDFAYHGRSIGNMALHHVIDAAKRAGASFVSLNVNKGNQRAQRAYLRAGFYRWRSEKEELGGGFFKDDYVMRYDLTPAGDPPAQPPAPAAS